MAARDGRIEDLDRFLGERGQALICTAVLLTGSREAGEDLLQTALERLLRNWSHIEGNPEGYLRRSLYNLATDGWRRELTRRRKWSLLQNPDRTSATDGTDQIDLRDALVRLLLQLPPRQRAVLVLRYWEQLTEAEAAAVLGCSEGTVKSAASRGLRRLRDLAGTWPEAETQLAKGRP